MTTQQIQSKLIDHYSLAIERVKEAGTYEKAREIIADMDVHNGVGWCASWVFGQDISKEVWVKWNDANRKKSRWGQYPRDASKIGQILSRLQLRLDILKKEYSLSIETIK